MKKLEIVGEGKCDKARSREQDSKVAGSNGVRCSNGSYKRSRRAKQTSPLPCQMRVAELEPVNEQDVKEKLNWEVS